ncbi:hypothetical protein Hanom_Chr04g00336571 [Helianthus anomalus]
MCHLPNFAKTPYISKSNLPIMSIYSHLYFNFLLLRVNVDGRKQELIDAPEASVLFSGLLTQRKVYIAIICIMLDFQFCIKFINLFFNCLKRLWFFDVLYLTTYVWLIRH